MADLWGGIEYRSELHYCLCRNAWKIGPLVPVVPHSFCPPDWHQRFIFLLRISLQFPVLHSPLSCRYFLTMLSSTWDWYRIWRKEAVASRMLHSVMMKTTRLRSLVQCLPPEDGEVHPLVLHLVVELRPQQEEEAEVRRQVRWSKPLLMFLLVFASLKGNFLFCHHV